MNPNTPLLFIALRSSVAALVLWMTGAASAADITDYLVAKGVQLSQTNATSVVPGGDEPYLFISQVTAAGEGSITQASVQVPGGMILPLLNSESDPQQFGTQGKFATKGALDLMFTNGAYHFVIAGTNDGTRTPMLSLPNDMGGALYPNNPRITNWAAAQSIDPFGPFTFVWDRFTGGSATDFIQVSLKDDMGDVFRTPSPGEPDALNGAAVSVVIPSGTLQPGKTYTGELLFANTVQFTTNDYPGARGLAAYFKATEFSVTTQSVPDEGRIQFDGVSFNGAEGEDNATIRLVRLGGSQGDVSVRFATENMTATAGEDYVSVSRRVTFGAGETNAEVEVGLIDDFLLEGPEQVRLLLSDVQGGAELGRLTNAVLTILDNEVANAGMIQFSAANYTVSEGAGMATITLTRSGGSSGGVSVIVGTLEGGSATPGADYLPTNRVVEFANGVTSASFTVRILPDDIDETNEVFRVGIMSADGGVALGSRTTATVTINDDDAGGMISFSAALFPVSETNGSVAVIVRRLGGGADEVTANLAVVGGSATFTNDYSMSSTNFTLHFAAGEMAKTNLITIYNDRLAEGDETILLQLSEPTGGAKLGPITNATVAILDDEITVQFSAAVYTNLESVPLAMITVVRSGPAGLPISVDYATEDGGTATPGLDYFATNGTLQFAANVRKKAFAVRVINDDLVENTETVALRLSNPSPNTSAALGERDTAILQIRDNDAGGVIQFAMTNLNVRENAGSALLIVTRTMGLASNVTVHIRTTEITAEDGADYRGFSSNLVFGAREVKKMVRVPIIDDSLVEERESFRVTLSNPTGSASLGPKSEVVVNIMDNDLGGLVAFSRAEYVTNENAGFAKILVTRTGGAASNVTVRFRTLPGTNAPAVEDQDYTNVNTVLSFGSGETSQMVVVPLADDNLPDGNKSVSLTLSEITGGARLGLSNAVLRLLDDESSIAFSSATYEAGESAPVVNLTIVRTGATVTTARVDLATADLSASSGSDYVGTNLTLVLPPGVSSRVVPVKLLKDLIDETNETFEVRLSNPVGTQLGSLSNATVTIIDDDSAGTIQFSSATYSVTEGTPAALIKVLRSGGAADNVTVHFATGVGTATPGSDYQVVSTNLTFATGETMKVISIPIFTDTTNEVAETVPLALTEPGGGGVLGATNTATLTINNKLDNDAVTTNGAPFMTARIGTLTFAAGTNVVANYTDMPSTLTIRGSFGEKELTLASLAVSGPGIVQLQESGETGAVIYTEIIENPPSVLNYASSRTGGGGSVTIDVLDLVNHVVTGRMNAIVVKQGDNSIATLTGSFRARLN